MSVTKKASDFFQKTMDVVQRILRNRIIAAILLLFQGINFISNSGRAMTDMVKSVVMTAAIAAFVSMIGTAFSREKGAGF